MISFGIVVSPNNHLPAYRSLLLVVLVVILRRQRIVVVAGRLSTTSSASVYPRMGALLTGSVLFIKRWIVTLRQVVAVLV